MRSASLITVVFMSIVFFISHTISSDILGCGGFIKSHVQIDFTKIQIKLYTRNGVLKEKTSCAPTNGYYFIPIYDMGDYIIQLEPPAGWSFEPTKVDLKIDGSTDLCSQGKDINFVFRGFGITGKVESFGIKEGGPSGVTVTLYSDKELATTLTGKGGEFFFTPIYPGNYTVKISHDRWNIIKDLIEVKVTEGNTELPPNSLVLGGYDVKGFIKNDNVPVKGVTIVLFEDENNKNTSKVSKCNLKQLQIPDIKSKQLCHVISGEDGTFIFPNVSPGEYFVIPFLEKKNTFFAPDRIKFVVNHESTILDKSFEVKGFSVSGKVLTPGNGKPVVGAKIYLNDVEVAETASDGSYTLEKIKANKYKLKVVADMLKFEEKVLNISPNILNLPDITPSSYQVCGVVISEHPQTVQITDVNKSRVITVASEKGSGKFCEYLPPSKYQFDIKLSSENQNNGIQFFPSSHTIEVKSSPISGIVFSQLKSVITGTVKCIREQDCKLVKIILKALDNNSEEIETSLKDSKYTIKDVKPGKYEINLVDTSFCWNQNKYELTVSSVEEKVPSFLQLGYRVTFISSHDTKMYYKTDASKTVIEIFKGKTNICVPNPQKYEFVIFDSCHVFNEEKLIYNVEDPVKEINLIAVKHKIVLGVHSDIKIENLTMSVSFGGNKVEINPVGYENENYLFELLLAPSETVIVVPQSDIFFFSPPILSINGNVDCVNMGSVFKAVKGKVFKGRIVPALAGVLVTIETENSESLIDETNEKGEYKFPPLDDTQKYKLTAAKSSFVFIGPDENGTFFAHKLAEIVVEVLDTESNLPLQGALLSLSGGDSYRSNLQTSENGVIRFTSLSPSDYFLRPMMKEYVFEPNSKIVSVKEGATVNIQLKGRRVAFSVYGQVLSLNGEPEEGLNVLASGLDNCSHITEETTSELNGNFRIRGLHSFCSYSIQLKQTEKNSVEQVIPEFLNISMKNGDIKDLRFLVIRPIANMNVLLKLYSSNPDDYKNLKVKLVRESSVIQSVKLDVSSYDVNINPGLLIHSISVPRDHKTYSIIVENSMLNSVSKNKAHSLQFVASSPFFYGELEFETVKTNFEQQIKQTSVWTLVFIFAVLIASYNFNSLVLYFKLNGFKFNFLDFLLSKRKGLNQNQTTYVSDENEVEQIVKSINAPKKKVKPRKV